MLIQFIAVVLLIVSLDACRADKRNSERAQTNEPETQTKPAPTIETKVSATPEGVRDSRPLGQIPRDWRLSLQTSGGIAGLGAGNLTVESSGKVVFEQRVRPNWQIKTCRADLNADETQHLRNLLAEWRTPDEETPTHPNIPAPDAFTYRLEINSGAGDKIAAYEWSASTFETLPKPDKILIEALSEMREKIRSECD